RVFAELLGVRPEEVALDHVGLNHLTWERRVVVDGADRLPELLDAHSAAIAADVDLPEVLLRRLRVVPSYYLRYFYAHDETVEKQMGRPTRGEQVAEIERSLLQIYADPTIDTKPELLGSRGGAFYSEAAIRLVASLTGDRGDVQVVNVRNDGCLSCLPDDAVIEVPAVIGAKSAAAVELEQPAPLFAGLIAHT